MSNYDIGKIDILGIQNTSGVNSSNQNTKVDGTNDNTGISWLSGGQGDQTLFSQAGQALNEFEQKVNTGLTNYLFSEKRSGRYEKLLATAQNIDAKGIPDKIHEGLSNFRNKVLTSDVFGEVVGSVLGVVYNIGKELPIIGGIVGAISKMITPNDVRDVINNTLEHIETDFFQNIEANEDYQMFREKVLEALSLENIVKVTHNMSNTSLAAGIAATTEGGTTADVINAIKEGKEYYKQSVADGTMNGISEASPYVMGTIGTVLSSGAKTAVNVVTDESVKSTAKSFISGLPELASETGNAASQLMGIATSLMGKISL